MRIKQALTDLKEGIRAAYPPCCILNFCLDTLTDPHKTVPRYVRGREYAPCILHMKAYHQSTEKAIKELTEDSNIDLW